MKERMHDVAVVGAGPAGSRTARLLEQRGLDVAVLEARPVVGSPVQCSGLISRNLDRLVRVPKACVEHRVSSALVHGPGGRTLELRKGGVAAYVIDREAFDRHMAGLVGSPIHLDTRVKGLRLGRQGVTLSTSKGKVRARALVGADGPDSVVRSHFKVSPPETAQGIIAITREQDSSDSVELWLDRKVCDGFLWRIPRGGSVEHGMLGSRVSYRALEGFFRLRKGYVRRAGRIPMGGCKSHFHMTLLVGDAAAQTKPWSGGGVVYGLTCASLAARALEEALGQGDLSEQALSAYEEAWKKEIGKPICLGMMARDLYRQMPEDQLAGYFDQLSGMDLSRLDMDFPALDIL